MKTIRKPFRLVAAAAAFAVAALGLALPAAADPATATIKPSESVSLTIHKHQGPTVGKTVNVSGTDYNCDADGTALPTQCIDTSKNPGIQGAKFAVYRVKDVDLTTNAGWAAARTYYDSPALDLTNPTILGNLERVGGTDHVYTTTSNGQITINNDDLRASDPETEPTKKTAVGLYYVVEQTGPDGTFTVDGKTYTGAVPFFVTLPMTDPDGPNNTLNDSDDRTTWMYDVHVYPKNDKVLKPHKATFDEGKMTPTVYEANGVDVKTLGSEIKYRVSTEIPNYGDVVGQPNITNRDDSDFYTSANKYGAADNVYNQWDMQYLFIQDTFPADLIVPTNVTEAVPSVKVIKATADPTKKTTFDDPGELLATLVHDDGTDSTSKHYKVTRTTNADQTVTVKVDFTGPGLNKLAELVTANPGAQVVVEFKTNLKTIPAGGLINNTAVVPTGPRPTVSSTPAEPPATPETPNPINPTNKTINKYGIIEIHKVGLTATSHKPLNGVKFEVYLAKKTGGPNASGVFEGSYSCKPADLIGANGTTGTSATPLTSFTTGGKMNTTNADAGYGRSPIPLQLSTWYNDGVEKSTTPAGTYPGGFLTGAQYAAKYGSNKYCLVETKAVDDYQLLAEPVLFELTKEGTTETFDAAKNGVSPNDWWAGTDAAGQRTVQWIYNDADNLINQLPLTGGQGVVAITVVGMLLIGAGSAAYTASQRKRREAEAAAEAAEATGSVAAADSAAGDA